MQIVMSSLDDAKAEETTLIDLHGKTSIADAMIVTTGRSNVHVNAIADRVFRAIKDTGRGIPRIEGTGQRRLGADRRGRYHRPRLPPGSAAVLQSGKDVGRGSAEAGSSCHTFWIAPSPFSRLQEKVDHCVSKGSDEGVLRKKHGQ